MAHSATALRAPVVRAPEPEVQPAVLPGRAGWFSDPDQRATSRFFDGIRWTEHTRGPAPIAALNAAAAAAAAARGSIEARSYGRFENRPALAALILGAVSIVLNPLLVPSILAVVLGVRGLRRSRMSLSRYGRERAATGIVLAVIGVATAAVTLAAAFAFVVTPAVLHAQHAAEAAAVRAAVEQHVADRGAELATLDCPPTRPGTPVRCTATTSRHEGLKLNVLLPASGGAVQVTDPPVPPPPPRHRARHR